MAHGQWLFSKFSFVILERENESAVIHLFASSICEVNNADFKKAKL